MKILSCNTSRGESVDGNSYTMQVVESNRLLPSGPGQEERPSNPGRALEVAGQSIRPGALDQSPEVDAAGLSPGVARRAVSDLDECRKMRNDLIKQPGQPGGVESADLGRRADLSHSDEYEAGVRAACEWLERQTLTEDEQREGISWGRTCPETFAWAIRKWLLPNY